MYHFLTWRHHTWMAKFLNLGWYPDRLRPIENISITYISVQEKILSFVLDFLEIHDNYGARVDWSREFIFSCFLAPEFDFRHVGCTKKPKYLLCFFISFIFESSTWFLLGHRSQEGTIQCIFYIFFLISVHIDMFC